MGWHVGSVDSIDRSGKALVLSDGRRIEYDFLVLSPGIEYMEETVAGYAEARAIAPVGIRAFEQTAVRQQFDKFLAEGGEFVVTVPKPPYRYPPAPIAPALIRKAGLGQRWASVALPTFQSTVDENIYVIGDAAGLPLPKSGHLAFETGALVAAQIAARVRGAPMAKPSGTIALPSAICWGFVSHTEAFAINVTASMEAGQAPKLQFKVDPRGNPVAARGATEWAEGLWNAMLG